MCFNILNIFRLLRINVAWEIEVVFVFLYLIVADKSSIFRYFQFTVPCINDLADVLLAQTILIAVFYKTFEASIIKMPLRSLAPVLSKTIMQAGIPVP